MRRDIFHKSAAANYASRIASLTCKQRDQAHHIKPDRNLPPAIQTKTTFKALSFVGG